MSNIPYTNSFGILHQLSVRKYTIKLSFLPSALKGDIENSTFRKNNISHGMAIWQNRLVHYHQHHHHDKW